MDLNSIIQEDTPQEDILVRAETSKRFINYLVDILFFYFLMFVVGIFIAIFAPSFFNNMDDSSGFNLMEKLLSLVLYATYMGMTEAFFNGKSLGKLITKTRAVHMDGSWIGWEKAFARGFSRAVPFCAFSAFGDPCNPWQDRWTSTMVIDENASRYAASSVG